MSALREFPGLSERLTLGVLGRSPRLGVNLENKDGVLLPSDSGFKKRNPKSSPCYWFYLSDKFNLASRPQKSGQPARVSSRRKTKIVGVFYERFPPRQWLIMAASLPSLQFRFAIKTYAFKAPLRRSSSHHKARHLLRRYPQSLSFTV